MEVFHDWQTESLWWVYQQQTCVCDPQLRQNLWWILLHSLIHTYPLLWSCSVTLLQVCLSLVPRWVDKKEFWHQKQWISLPREIYTSPLPFFYQQVKSWFCCLFHVAFPDGSFLFVSLFLHMYCFEVHFLKSFKLLAALGALIMWNGRIKISEIRKPNSERVEFDSIKM